MRQRPSARLLVINNRREILLFKFVFKQGALVGKDFWATPGGELEAGETFEEAARRELFEETGITIETPQEPLAERRFELILPDGEPARAHEKFYVVRVENPELSRGNWTQLEMEVLAEHKWWNLQELRETQDTIYPADLAEIAAGEMI